MNTLLRLITIGMLTFSSAGQSLLPARWHFSGLAPTAISDDYTTSEDTILQVPVSGAPYNGILDNDSDPENDPLLAVLVNDVQHGSLSLQTNGSFSYTPAGNWSGTDSFTYRADDSTSLSNEATVSIVVTPVNDAPVAVADSYTTPEDTLLSIPAAGVITNDTQVDTGETVTAVLDNYAGGGQLTLDADGSFDYTPALNFNGTDSFTYHVNDGTSDSNIVQVSLTVTAVNDPPQATADEYTTPEDTELVVSIAAGVLHNDFDAEDEPLTAGLDVSPEHGALVFQSNGSFTYSPDENWNGTDHFTYHAVAGGVNSQIVVVDLIVSQVNDLPVAINDNYPAVEDVELTINAPGLLVNDGDPDQSPLSAYRDTQPAHGSVVVNTDGSFTYTPEANYAGIVTFSYHVNDGQGNSAPATVTLTIAAVNDAPTAVNDAYGTNEDTPLIVGLPGVLANDTDVETGSTLTPSIVTSPGHGTIQLNPNGSFEYRPAANYFGADQFTYTVSDGELTSNTATVAINVTSVNDVPVALDDAFDAVEDVILTVNAPGILANDTDIETTALTTVILTHPAHGSVTMDSMGGFTYQPEANYHGIVTFTYHAFDGTDPSNIATVTLNISGVNDPPEATDNNYETNEDTPRVLSAPGVLGNDRDVDGDTITAVANSLPLHGTLSLSANGGFTYTPVEDWYGRDTFTYHATDGTLNSNIATVTIDVNSVNDNPITLPDSYDVTEDIVLTVTAPGVLGNDRDIEGSPMQAIMGAAPVHGSVQLNSNGSFTYTPETNYNGSVTFTYRASDGTGSSPLTTVTLNIAAVNDPPVPVDNTYLTTEDTFIEIAAPGVIANDTDVDNPLSSLSAYLFLSPQHGVLNFNSDGSFRYTPAANYNGPDTFTYYLHDASDRSLGEATVTINISSVNDIPVTLNDTYTTDEDTQLSVTLPLNGILGNDTDVDGDTLRAVLVNGPAHGNLTLNQNGTFLYTPAANYNGTDSFTYRAGDGTAQSALPAALVTIHITAVNDAPTASGQLVSTAEEVPLNLALVASDVDLDPLTYSIFTPPGHGALTGNMPNIAYTPELDYNGQDSFVFQVSDGQRTASALVSITVTAINDAPVGVGDAFTFDEDNVLTINLPGVLGNDRDVDSSNLTVSPSTGPSHGNLTLNANGSFVYSPVSNYYGPDTFSYQVSDGALQSTVTLVTLEIRPVNDDPITRGESYTSNEDIPIIINAPGLLSNDSDVDLLDTLSAAHVTASGPAHGTVTINPNGSFNYKPEENYNGPDAFSYTVTDGHVITPPVSVSINLIPVNDAPDTLEDSYTTPMDTVIEVPAPGLLANDSDVDDTAFTARLVQQPSRGTIESFKPDGSFTYRTPINSQGDVIFKYAASDGKNESVETEVTIHITTVQQLSMKWVAPVADNHRYYVGPEEIPLETEVTIPDGFPCLPAYLECNPNYTYGVTAHVRYYIHIGSVWQDIEVVEGPNYRTLFDTSIIDKTYRASEMAAVASVQVIVKDENGNQIGEPIVFATPRARVYIYRIPLDGINRSYLPLSRKQSPTP